jgi:MFS family permease
VTVIVVGLVTAWSLNRIDSAPADDVEAVTAGATLSIVLSVLVPLALQLIGSALLQGVIVVEVARATLGQKLRLAALWRAAGRRLWVLVLWTALLAGALVVGVGVLAGLVTLLVFLGDGFVALAVIVGIMGGLGLLALGLWLSTKTSLVPSLIVLERVGIRAAIARSWLLTRGYFWRTLGIQLLVAAIVTIVSQIVTTPLGLVFTYAVGLVDPNGAFEDYLPSIIVYVLTLFIALIFGAVAAVVQSATTSLIYLDLRMRTEGLDLELQRFVESGQGWGRVENPYLVPPTRQPPA